MVDELIPADIRDFILRHIASVGQGEALLLLRANPAEAWDVSKIARRLYTSDKEIAELLAQLCHDGLLTGSNGLFRYECASEEQCDLIDRLAAIYSRHLIPVTNMIHGKPRRIRQFADAFKFRKDP
jgi:hypothetical protein